MSDQGPSAPPAPVPPPLPPTPAPVPATPASAPSAPSALVPPYPPARDLQKTLPGTGVLPLAELGTKLVDGDSVVNVLRDFDLTIQRLGVAMHKRLDKVDLALAPSPMTMADRAKSGAVNLGKYTGVAVVAAAIARAVEHKYPGIAEPVDAVLKALNL